MIVTFTICIYEHSGESPTIATHDRYSKILRCVRAMSSGTWRRLEKNLMLYGGTSRVIAGPFSTQVFCSIMQDYPAVMVLLFHFTNSAKFYYRYPTRHATTSSGSLWILPLCTYHRHSIIVTTRAYPLALRPPWAINISNPGSISYA